MALSTIFTVLGRSCPGRVASLQCAVLFAALKRTNIKTMVNKEKQESSLPLKSKKEKIAKITSRKVKVTSK